MASLNNLYLTYHDLEGDELEAGGGVSVYAMIHDPVTGNAIDFSSAPYQFDQFDGDQSKFSISLSENSPRTKHWSVVVTGPDVEIEDSVYGFPYEIEYWVEAASGVQSRTADILLKVDLLPWADGFRRERIILDLADAIDGTARTQYVSYCSFSYDTENSRLAYSMWLEKDAEVVVGSSNATIIVYDSSGTVLFTDTVVNPNIAGAFYGEQVPFVIYPDEIYYATCSIDDVDAATHTSATSPVSWD